MSIKHILLLSILAILLGSNAALATYPPPEGMLERMAQEGTLADAQEFARQLGNHEMKRPKRGALDIDQYSPQQVADLISANLGRSLDERTTSEVGKMTSTELAWVELDLNHDGMVDERDLLVLGHPQPKQTATIPSLGYNKMLTILIEFPDYPQYFDPQSIHDVCYSPTPLPNYHLGSMRWFYDQASYGACTLDGDTFGWYMAQNPRTYYHPDDNSGGGKREELILEACDAADAAGLDFNDYDNDGDGVVDEFIVIWTGPHGDWATFWWGYHTGMGNGKTYDGVRLGSYSWQWERGYYFNNEPPTPDIWSADVVIHETGHGFGLPDYYDYDGSVGPDGGVGSMDRMDGYRGEHGCFSKYILGWLQPTIAYTNLDDEALDVADANPDCVLFMPGYDPATPWDEYFMAQNRGRGGIDYQMPTDGVLIWHADARLNAGGGFLFNNSYTDHKLIRLMEADGLEEIENGPNHSGDAGDYYDLGESLAPGTTPSSDGYDAPTGMVVDDISADGATMTADFTLYPTAPPTVTLSGITPGSTVSGNVPLTITTTSAAGIAEIQLWVDGVLVDVKTGSGSSTPLWNTLVDFNKTMDVMARAYDVNGQSATDTVSVTVSNSGVVSFADYFNIGFKLWRSINFPDVRRGTWTQWETRACPASPPPISGGNEAYVAPMLNDNEWHNALDNLRSQRVNAVDFEYLVSISFEYRARDGFSLWYTTDEGQNWTLLDNLTQTNDWSTYNRVVDLRGSQFYLEFRYSGNVRGDNQSGRGANIDNISVHEAPSDPPTVQITSHVDGDHISNSTLFTADANDDFGIDHVDFYVNGGLAFTDSEAPYEYERNLVNDDNRPDIPVRVVATDSDGLTSVPDEVAISWDTERPFPLFDDCEISDDTGPNAWSFQNGGSSVPNWQWSTADAFSGVQSMAWTGDGSFSGDSEGVWFWGSRGVSEGRICVDLANPKVVDPVLRYKMTGNFPDGSGRGLYLYTTWYGWEQIGGWGDNWAEWTDVEFDLSGRIGHSGRIVWWVFGSSGDAAGIWLDDVEVTNATPVIDSISPGIAIDGEIITLSGLGFSSCDISKQLNFTEGTVLMPLDVVSWTDEEIQFAVPAGARGGNLSVTVNGRQSNEVSLVVRLASPQLTEIGGL
ncbi:MAG: M6 family metalloprotease domain-containing protein [Planctomycetales bacterium]|nr:M6 family metalloprotease domain-containing protein [bacterium]UNM08293.1 MAG: M6 family metalloprotease domain-containing protein [Planctomycetales bacterium]